MTTSSEELHAQIRVLQTIVEQRGIRLDTMDTRMGQMAQRLNMLEEKTNILQATQLVHDETQRKDDRYQQIVITMVSGTAALALGSIGLAITTLITLLNHIAVK